MMETQERNESTDDKVIVLHGNTPLVKMPLILITQKRLAENRRKARQAHEALAALEGDNKELREALKIGVSVEDGPLKAYLKPKSRKAFTSKACTYFELVIE